MLPNYFSQEPLRPLPPVGSVGYEANTRSSSLAGKRVVIVEDEGITQLQLAKILRSEGLLVVGAAANGQEAIEVVLNTQPDLVLMDINMPVMNGLDATKHILAQTWVCIVMLTAFAEEEYQKRAQALGSCGYVLKPITSETLIPQLEAALANLPPSA